VDEVQPAFALACPLERRRLWHLPPQFLKRHVRMEDARQYIADVLAAYGELMTFQPAPRPGAVCYRCRAMTASPFPMLTRAGGSSLPNTAFSEVICSVDCTGASSIVHIRQHVSRIMLHCLLRGWWARRSVAQRPDAAGVHRLPLPGGR